MVVLDLFSRKVIGWSMGQRMDTALVTTALNMALLSCRPQAGVLHHSDQGSQYTGAAYCDCLHTGQAQLSMSGAGNCYDNAVVESFFGTLKPECITGVFPTRALTRTTIFEYIEVWYNRNGYTLLWASLAPSTSNNSPFNRVHLTGGSGAGRLASSVSRGTSRKSYPVAARRKTRDSVTRDVLSKQVPGDRMCRFP